MFRCVCALLFCAAPLAAQTAVAPAAPMMPHDYHSPVLHVDGLWVTPVPNAPFTAIVNIVSHQILQDGTEHVVRTENHIARSSSGRIRNERRALVPVAFTGTPRLYSAHLYDPTTRISVFTDEFHHIARETTLPQPPHTPSSQAPPDAQRQVPGITETPLGTQLLDGVQLVGTRKTHVVPATASGQPVTITDDYWFSPDLSLYLIIKHNDPRTGEQIVAVTHIERAEPPAELMTVPSNFKIVDENPPAENIPDGCSAGYC